ncbi:hypothetical protein ATANTOWER_021627 [Ataeniobius toweri]|uniref:Uncharacterized protein n=1 Tax=Ataeniobius toweri TaxID=208326 RepID=A0ABU7A7J4_9TELE|nr:hypothetical protein [Ataeniobius toweri]
MMAPCLLFLHQDPNGCDLLGSHSPNLLLILAELDLKLKPEQISDVSSSPDSEAHLLMEHLNTDDSGVHPYRSKPD